jgi:outer membrane lipoprotein-sorting protein
MRKTLLAYSLLAVTLAHAQEMRSGNDLLRAMHERYASSWYQTVTFTQKSTTYKPDGTSSAETWYEAASIPGKLRIDLGSPTSGNGYVLVDGDVSVIKDNKVADTRHSVNMLLVLGFDVYRQDPEKTVRVVKDEGYNLSKLHEDEWDGRAVYVVGADADDLKSKQFWVEKDSLLFVRIIEPGKDASKMNDIRFTNYRRLARAWIAAGVEVWSEGKKVFSEDYSDIQADVKLPAGTFDPARFETTHWEK